MQDCVQIEGVEILAASDSALTCKIDGRDVVLPRPPVRIESVCMGRASLQVPVDIARTEHLVGALSLAR